MWDECGIGLCATMLKMLGRCGIFTGPHNFYNLFSFLGRGSKKNVPFSSLLLLRGGGSAEM